MHLESLHCWCSLVFDKTDKGIILRVRISPNSSSCGIKGIFTSAEGLQFLKINVVSVPEKGKANREVIEFLAKKLRIAKSAFEIIFGDTDKYKKILIISDKEETIEKLSNLVKEVA